MQANVLDWAARHPATVGLLLGATALVWVGTRWLRRVWHEPEERRMDHLMWGVVIVFTGGLALPFYLADARSRVEAESDAVAARPRSVKKARPVSAKRRRMADG